MNRIATLAREAVDPKIVDRFDRLWALVMLATAAWSAGAGDWGVAILILLFALTVLVADVNQYHAYRDGYFVGVAHSDNGVVTEDPQPSDARKLWGESA